MADGKIKGGDLFEDDGVIKRLIEQLKEAEENLDAYRKQAAKAEAALKKLTGATDEEAEQIAFLNKQSKTLLRNTIRLNNSRNDAAKELARVRAEQTTVNRLTKNEAKLAQAAAGSYDALSAELSILKTRYKQLSEAEREFSEEGTQVVARINEVTDKLKELDANVGVNSRNVGNYKESVKEAINELGGLPGAAGQAADGLDTVSAAMRKLMRNPLLLFLGLIVGALGALFTGFKNSERGAELFARASGVAKGVMSELTDVSLDAVDFLSDAWDDPIGAIKDVGKALLDNILNRLKAIPLVGQAAMDAFKALWNRDFEGIKAAGEDALFAVNQAVTGLTETQVTELAEDLEEVIKEVEKTASAFADLESRKRAIIKANRGLVRSIERITTAEALATATADDTTKSFAEREAAAEKARAALEEKAGLEIRLARNNLSLINAEIDLRKANGEQVESLLDSQLNAYRELKTAERGYTLAVRDNERTRAELKQDRLERDLDILIDGADNQKAINERLLQDERLTLDARAQILRETQRLVDDSFAEQIATIQQFTGTAIDANALLEASDARALNQKIRGLGLSESIEGRLLEIVRERRTAVRDLEEAEVDLAEAVEKAAAAKIRAAEDERKQRFAAAKRAFEDRQALAESEFKLAERTSKEQAAFQIDQDIALYEFRLKAAEEFGEALTEVQRQTLRNQIAGLRAERERLFAEAANDDPKDIYQLLGINFGSDKKNEAAKQAFNFVKQQALEFLALQRQIAEAAVQTANQRVSSAEAALQAELTALSNGQAARVETRRQELADEKRQQEKALAQRKKALAAERLVQAAQTGVQLALASAKILAKFPFPTSLPFIGLMFGAFATAQVKAAKLAKQTRFGGGGQGKFRGSGSHATGNHIAFGQDNGTQLVAEPNERWAVFNKRAVAKYGPAIPSIVDAINLGKLGTVSRINHLHAAAAELPYSPQYHLAATDMSTAERHLAAIARNTRRYTYVDARGNLVVVDGNDTTTYLK